MQFDITRVNDVFADFYQQLEEAKKVNEQTVFQYETPAGNKAARSHIYKLRQSKTAISEAHKNAKAKPLEFTRALDSEKKKLISEIEGMIEIHDKPLKEIEELEKVRIAEIEQRISDIHEMGREDGLSSIELQAIRNDLENLVIDESFAELKVSALEAKDYMLKILKGTIEFAKGDEAEKAELERLRKEAAERDQKDRDERIAREAREQAERKAHEEKVRAEFEAKAEKERIEREKKEAIELAEREKQQAVEQAEQAKREQIAQEERAKIEKQQAEERQKAAVEQAKQDEIDRQNAEKQLVADEQAKREANKRHIGNIRRDAKESIMELGINENLSKQLVMAIHNQQIANVTINY